MSKVKLLDCTLRDGGYINQWNFGEKVIYSICEKLFSANIDIVEAGFLTDLPHTADQSLYSGAKELERLIPKDHANTKIAAMIALGEKEMDPRQLPEAKDTDLDIVRLTFHNQHKEQQRAIDFAHCLMSKGYQVCMQPVGTTSYTDADLLRLIGEMNELQPFAFYLVDTLGVLYKQELLRLLYLIDHNLSPNICIGFHSHNNVQMSFANTQEIIEFQSERQFIVDSSVYGMGRGAGNLCTEIVAEFLNKTVEERYNIVPLMEIVDECLIPIFMENSWGYSAGYFLSATKNCHPNYATYLLSRQTLRVRDIGEILRRIPLEQRPLFNRELIKTLYLDFQNNEIDDKAERERLKTLWSRKRILLIGPGKSVVTQRKMLQKFIDQHNPYIISVNFEPDFPVDMVFLSNQKRFSNMDEVDTEKFLFTSNVKNRPQKAHSVNYSSLLNNNDLIYDNAGLMLIRLLEQSGILQIWMAGFDGFVHNQTENYFDQSQMGLMEQERIESVNKGIESQLQQAGQKMKITFLTQTHYQLG